MEIIYFYEEQSFRKNKFFIFILIFCIAPMGVNLYGVIRQLAFGLPFGNHPLSNEGLIMTSVFISLFIFIIFWIVFQSKLITKIDNTGILYRFKPFHFKYRKLVFADIEKYEVRQYKPVGEFGGWGLRYNFRRKETAYNVSGNWGIELYLKNGKKFLLGTQKPEELKSAIKKLI